MKRHALALLVLFNLALALALAWMWLHKDASLRNVHWTAPQPLTSNYLQMLPALPTLASLDASRFLVLLERPLFALDRRPPPPPSQVAVVTEAPVDNFSTATVSGLVSGDGTGTIIIHIAGKDRRVKLNESVEGWTLKKIEGRSATFSSNGQTRSLQLPRAAVSTYSGAALPAASASALPSASAGATDASANANANANAGPAAAPDASPVARRKSRFGP